MSFNVNEMKRIARASKDELVRTAVSQALADEEERAQQVLTHDFSARHESLVALSNAATKDRHAALAKGAKNEKDPHWASAAARETWLQTLISEKESDIIAVGQLVEKIHSNELGEFPEKEASVWPLVIYLAVVFGAFKFVGVWLGIGVAIAGLVALGWSKRHEGPL